MTGLFVVCFSTVINCMLINANVLLYLFFNNPKDLDGTVTGRIAVDVHANIGYRSRRFK